MDNRLLKVKKIYSFDPTSSSTYKLREVNKCVVDKLIAYYNQLEKDKDYILCLRGDSRKNKSKHEIFFKNELMKIFIVGQKAKSFLPNSSSSKYQHISDGNKNQLLYDINRLIDEVNNEISARPKSHNISGQIPNDFIKSLEKVKCQELYRWKIFFLSFLHNSGKNKSFSGVSPIISLTYGYNKYVTARKFALSRSKISKGIIFLYYLNTNWPYFIKSKNLARKLKDFGVNWYNDINTEIMLINGMYPHHLVGIFEVLPYSNPRFIINPWLYKMILNSEVFDFEKGIKVNQEHFENFAIQMGYAQYFFNYFNEQNQYISTINQTNYNKTPKPPQSV